MRVIMSDGISEHERRPECESALVRVSDFDEMHSGNESGQESGEVRE